MAAKWDLGGRGSYEHVSLIKLRHHLHKPLLSNLAINSLILHYIHNPLKCIPWILFWPGNFSEINLFSFNHCSLLFQLHDHEDVLEPGAYRAPNISQDHSDDWKITWGPTWAGTGVLVWNKVLSLQYHFSRTINVGQSISDFTQDEFRKPSFFRLILL